MGRSWPMVWAASSRDILWLTLAARVRELEESLASVRQLQGLLPMCSYCKSIRDDKNYWQEVEIYVRSHTDAEFSHSVCPGCWEKVVKPQFLKMGLPAPEFPS